MKSRKKKICIICPVYNEVDNIVQFYEEFSNVLGALDDKYAFEFLFADNRSTDNSFELLKSLCKIKNNVSIIRYSRNFGVMKSIYTCLIGVDASFDAAAVFDCDLQDPPALLVSFISEWEKGVKLVFGRRVKRDEPIYLGWLRKLYRSIERTPTIESGAWFLDKRLLAELKRKRRFEPFLPGLIAKLGFSTSSVDYDRIKRHRGTSKFNLAGYFGYATEGLIGGTTAPLRIALYVGFAMLVLTMLLAIYIFVAKVFLGHAFAAGVAASILISSLGIAVNLLLLGVIGEYVGRIYKLPEIHEPAIIDELIKSENFSANND